MKNKVKVSVIGLGYIGLPTAALLASHKIEVTGVDIDKSIVDIVNQGNIHIVEPELDNLVHTAVHTGYLKAVMKPERSDVFMIAVPTPFKRNNEPDLRYIESASKEISQVLKKGDIVILESTSPVGTTELMVEWMQKIRPDLSFPTFGEEDSEFDISVAHCPERVLPGHVVRELVSNNRIIGGITNKCANQVKNFYRIFVKAGCMVTDCRTAELSKLVENSFRDVNIAFANELSLVCDKLGIDVWDLIKLANRHPRVNIMQPGPGVGGHCIAVDPWFIVHSTPNESKLIRTARMVNDNKPKYIISKIDEVLDSLNKPLLEISVACLGMAFKPDIDDLRESPAIKIIQTLITKRFKKIYIIEPNISLLPSNFDTNSVELTSIEKGVKLSEVVVVLVSHKEFSLIDKELLKEKNVIDAVGLI